MYLYIYPAGPALLECTRRTHLLFPSVRAYPQGGWVHLRDESRRGKKNHFARGNVFARGYFRYRNLSPSLPPATISSFSFSRRKKRGKIEHGTQYSSIPVSGMDKVYAFYWIDNNPVEKRDSVMYK